MDEYVSDCCGAETYEEIWCLDEDGNYYLPLKGKVDIEDKEEEMLICSKCHNPCQPKPKREEGK